ncbi:MAG: ABC transporter ATP-binding protein [Betaproteobacteria bacterium]|nr:ABC transporter ATP-binding protein [Betaproteobacteria bacterium]
MMATLPRPRDAAAREVKVDVDIAHSFGALCVHDGLQFAVRENEFLCLCGPSGCGKTTLLDILAGLLKPTRGRVLVHGEPVDPKRHNISFVFQEPSTLPWLTVRNNVAVGLRIKKRPEAEVRRVVDDILGVVNLRGYEDYYPHQISGGMKQRVAIARAFATDADVILMDEPFVSLDQPTRERMQAEVLSIWERKKGTIIFVTHNLEEAVFLGDRTIVLSAKPARILADVPITLPRPRNTLSPEFMRLRTQFASLLNSALPSRSGR